MNGKLQIISFTALAISLSCSPLAAHHGAAAYDTDKRVTVKGTVTDWLWSNPHCILQLDAPGEGGQVVHWVTETENPSSMIRSGWTRDAIKVGDEISVIVVPPKAGGHVGRIVEVTLPDGHKLLGRGTTLTPAKPDEPAKP
ncbi:MAG TPA: DUF6152 family protein [Bryobacteraceae bacterium]|nr:DUF6152 family protein [Bryobacteraceae bacterium]